MGVSSISSALGGFVTPDLRSLARQHAPVSSTQSGNAAATGTDDNTLVTEDDTSRIHSQAAANSTQDLGKLSKEALNQIAKLKARDAVVRQHEAAHLAAAGGMATSGASFTYQKGPDGVSYAIGGEVGIDMSPGRTPEETIARANRIRAAALAPADPSGQDLAVAAKAQQMELQAQSELAQQKLSNTSETTDHGATLNRAYGKSEDNQRYALSVFA